MTRFDFISVVDAVPGNRLLAVSALVAAVALSLVAGPALAVPAGITFSRITPVDGNTLLVARTAANDPLDAPTFQLKADLYLDNAGPSDREVTAVTFHYLGSGIADLTYTPKRFVDDDDDPNTPNVAQNWVMPAGDEGRVAIHDGLSRDLATPLPASVEISVYLDADPTPLVVALDLAFRENGVPLGAHYFPARASDLAPGEYWSFGTRHVVDSGGGVGGVINPSTRSQRYALDMGVAAWDGDLARWSDLHAGTDGSANTDYRVWGKPLYATADGFVVACFRGEPDEEPAPFDQVSFDFGFGNSVFIQSGSDLVSYGHMQDGSIPDSVCPDAADAMPSTGLSIPVQAGDFLGLVGNTGRSTAPHLHIQVEHVPPSGPDTVSGAPMQFLNVRALADDDDVNNLGDSPALEPLHGKTLHRRSLILPNPCGMDLPPSGLAEVSRHGIPAACYQDTFHMIVGRGYRPVFVDGFDVGGATYFNATFRPAGPASVARHGLTGAEYQDLFDDLTGAGYRLHQVDAYLQGGEVRYAAIFEVRAGPDFSAFHGLTDAEYGDAVDALAADGYVPVNVSTVEVGGDRYWTGLFEQVAADGWTVETVHDEDYQAVFDANEAAGRVLTYVHGFRTGAGPMLTGVFVAPVADATAAVHGFTSATYQDAFDDNLAAGRLTRYVTGYDDGAGQALYAAVWRARPNTLLTQAPPLVTNATSAAFGFEPSLPFATFQCRLDFGPYGDCSSPHLVLGLSEGSHTFSVRAVDRELLRDPSPANHTWLVDTTPPGVQVVWPLPNTKTVHGVPKNDPVEETTVIGWSDVVSDVTDDLSGVASVQFEVDGAPVGGNMVDADTWQFTFEPDENGENTYLVEIVATDHAGNVTTASIEILGVKTGKKR